MTRAECEMKLLEVMEMATAIYKEYNPNGNNLSMSNYSGQISISDALEDENGNFINPKNYFEAHSVYLTKFADGKINTGADWGRIFREVESE